MTNQKLTKEQIERNKLITIAKSKGHQDGEHLYKYLSETEMHQFDVLTGIMIQKNAYEKGIADEKSHIEEVKRAFNNCCIENRELKDKIFELENLRNLLIDKIKKDERTRILEIMYDKNAPDCHIACYRIWLRDKIKATISQANSPEKTIK